MDNMSQHDFYLPTTGSLQRANKQQDTLCHESESRELLIINPEVVKENLFLLTPGCPPSTGAALYLSGVLEYILAEVLDLAGRQAHHRKKIKPVDVITAVRNDEELDKFLLLKDITHDDYDDDDYYEIDGDDEYPDTSNREGNIESFKSLVAYLQSKLYTFLYPANGPDNNNKC